MHAIAWPAGQVFVCVRAPGRQLCNADCYSFRVETRRLAPVRSKLLGLLRFGGSVMGSAALYFGRLLPTISNVRGVLPAVLGQ